METTLTATLTSPADARVEGIPAEGFDKLVRHHQRRVYRVVFLLLRDADAADTITQECFLRAFQKRTSFRGECKVETWFIRIAVNLVRDHGKNRRVSFWRKLVGLGDDESNDGANFAAPHPSPERVLLAREELNAVWSAVTTLSPQQRTIFLLRYADEMQLTEIAEVLALKVGTVKAQLSRATGKVRETVKA